MLHLEIVIDNIFLVRTYGQNGVYTTEVLTLEEWTQEGDGHPVRGLGDDCWTRETMSEESARLAQDEAVWRAQTRRFHALEECLVCGRDIDPLDEGSEGGMCGHCVGAAISAMLEEVWS